MDRKVILKKLEELYHQEEVSKGWPSQQSCIEWSNKVAPLLKFNQQYYINFMQNAHNLNLNLSSYSTTPALNIMKSQIRMAIEELKIEDSTKEAEENSIDIFIDTNRIKELREISDKRFDLSKLFQFLAEINSNYQRGNYFSVIMLIRALIDHIPPIFDQKNFLEVVNNYRSTRSFKESMDYLEKSCRRIADQHLHCQIREKEVLPNKTQVNFSNNIDILLAEIVRLLKV